ncbi:MAG: sn-glycerol-3-phosphate ABC transporter ATP-binding protein UgpC [Candidatus Competibacteraceae bacterium]|nr:sn-glycerol-3-phosphate ABC transporter ATP-binding protein UgpC [Candidatus Competibacteraceae bacterium]MBK7985035.1 sn-glycerol-3-phosphate ABC transporter ATP-binding protein UgpC [Candidatus Competibacteraceae bacterium]MBK8895886.1 sn-glycerol-3-phosphate ABC transporter ATP-binding protein UgpC [Candidatus Competibacteraceae bacterium]MBK8962977.1 sn-glycerol-3-phosphate ABC transporter ATP-binding protein UgpC [Candidatus Competibacteraceae bacterium]MBK9953088.1 sn-glycerol-3-phosph
MADIRMRNVSKAFKDVRVIERVDLDIEDGEFAVFVGPSGCGKSTLLRLVAGLEDISSGEMTIGGKKVNNVPPSQRGVAMVFQSYALYPHMTIFDNMAFGLKLAKEDSGEIKNRVHWAAKILQMEHLLERLPKELSGGQRQRVAIGRAIVRKPGVFLFDEPLSNLDAALRVQTRIEISKLHHDLGASMIYVTHDQVEAMTLADKIVLLNAGKPVIEEGSVAQIGPPLELYHHPVNLFVAGFIGSPKMNFLPGKLASIESGIAAMTLPDGATVRAAVDASAAKPGAAVTLGIRPEHVTIGGGDNSVQAEVAYVEHLGESSFIYTQVPGVTNHVIVRQEGDTYAKMGDHLTLVMAPQHCHLFDEKGRAFKRRIEAVAETMPVLQ